MEHAVSDWLVDRIDAALGYPKTDPHGEPIPKADGTVAAPVDRRLVDCTAGEQFHVARVTDQSPDFLRFLSQAGLEIGTSGALVANEPSADKVTISIGGANQIAVARNGGKTDGALVAAARTTSFTPCRILDGVAASAYNGTCSSRAESVAAGGFR